MIKGGQADVFGYFQIIKSCDALSMAMAANNAASDAGIDMTKYDLKIVVGYFNCGWNGAYNSGSVLSILKDTTIAHELAHLVGHMQHGNFLNCGDKPISQFSECNIIEYGDPYSIIGKPSWLYHMPAPEKIFYLEPNNQITVLNSGRYSIAPLEIATSAAQIIMIPRNPQKIYIEYRQPIGFDLAIPKPLKTGAIIHVDNLLIDATPSIPSSEINPVLEIGKTFIDPGVVEISVLSINSYAMVLDIKLLNKPISGKGDINIDNKVDVTDLSILLGNWGATSKPASDLNQDGRVDVTDLGILLGNWG
jgi:hypothetical protein